MPEVPRAHVALQEQQVAVGLGPPQLGHPLGRLPVACGGVASRWEAPTTETGHARLGIPRARNSPTMTDTGPCTAKDWGRARGKVSRSRGRLRGAGAALTHARVVQAGSDEDVGVGGGADVVHWGVALHVCSAVPHRFGGRAGRQAGQRAEVEDCAGGARAALERWAPSSRAAALSSRGAAWACGGSGSLQACARLEHTPKAPAHSHSSPSPPGCPTPPTRSLQHGARTCLTRRILSKVCQLPASVRCASQVLPAWHTSAGHAVLAEASPHPSEGWSRPAWSSGSRQRALPGWRLHSRGTGQGRRSRHPGAALPMAESKAPAHCAPPSPASSSPGEAGWLCPGPPLNRSGLRLSTAPMVSPLQAGWVGREGVSCSCAALCMVHTALPRSHPHQTCLPTPGLPDNSARRALLPRPASNPGPWHSSAGTAAHDSGGLRLTPPSAPGCTACRARCTWRPPGARHRR